MWHTPLNTHLSIPIGKHPGAFAVVRKNHIHEGVDLYCEDGTEVYAVEKGVIINIYDFTGAKVGSDWWHDTMAVMVRGRSGLVVYGEINPLPDLKIGQNLHRGQHIGHVKRVLKNDKGRPTSMLHLELRDPYHAEAYNKFDWNLNSLKPSWLLDPTPKLCKIKF